VVFGPEFVGGGGIPDFGHAFSNYTYFLPTMWPIFVEFCSAISEIRRRKKEERKKERKKEETLAKYKSADILCRAA